ncbi:homoserine kinase, partial [Pseudoalteromonas sp. S558]
MIEVYAPASIGNFTFGFDSLGAAFAPIDGSLLGDVVTICEAPRYEFICSGEYGL